MANRLAGKVALITGGASGLGAAQAKRFAEEGAKVVIGDLNEEMAKGVVAEIRAAGGDALFIRLDVTDAASWNNAIAAAVEAFGGLTTLSNTAGIIHPGGFEEERSEEHTSELQSLMRTSYAVFCLKKKKKTQRNHHSMTSTHMQQNRTHICKQLINLIHPDHTYIANAHDQQHVIT